MQFEEVLGIALRVLANNYLWRPEPQAVQSSNAVLLKRSARRMQ